MNNNLLVELFDRLIELEKRVEVLEKNKDTTIVDDMKIDDTPKSRKEALITTISIINELNPELNAYKGSRKEGGGIIFRGMNIEKKRIKFYYSKSYDSNNLSAWHTINDYHISKDKSDFYILCVNYEERLYTFLFTYDELVDMISNKKLDQSEQYHFYIQRDGNNYYDNRDIESTSSGNCVTEHLDTWNKLG